VKMVTAVVQEEDSAGLLEALMAAGFHATKIASTGGFVHRGNVTMLIGAAFMRSVVHEDRSAFKQAASQARIAKNDMWRGPVSLLIVVIAICTTFTALTAALPNLFAERLADLTQCPALRRVLAGRPARSHHDHKHKSAR